MPPFASSRNFICGTKYTNRALSLPAQAHSQPACQMLPFPACHTPPPEARSLRAAAGLAGREGPPLPWPDRAGLVHHGLARHPVLDLRRHGHESLLDVGGVLGGRLEEGDANLVGKRLSSLIVHHLLRREIALVPHQELVHVLVGVAVDLVEPLLDVVEALLVRHIIHHNNAVSPAVVAAGDCAEALLPGSIPLAPPGRYSSQLDAAGSISLEHSPRRRKRAGHGSGSAGVAEIGASGRRGLTICSLITLPSSSTVRILKSTPMVEM
mmetsp:Transcript_24075/g.75431  ORF Transcript_24075/g.75431 Transcript_24075/m.75431 type:complete len:267 (+) Transcript_24075:560-1360(+)